MLREDRIAKIAEIEKGDSKTTKSSRIKQTGLSLMVFMKFLLMQ